MLNLFGKGFVGGWYCDTYPDEVVINKHDDYVPQLPIILDFISTVDNYNLERNLPFVDMNSNLTTTICLLENARRKFGNAFEFNFISSWFVYGKDAPIPAKETDPCNPTGFYSITKRCAEQLIQSYCENYGIKWRILRLANVLGVGDEKISRKKNALQYMISELARGHKVDYLYRGKFLRDFIDVRDCVRAIHAVVYGGQLNSIFNIGSGIGIDINDAVYKVGSKVGNNQIAYIDPPTFHTQVQTKDMVLDISKLMNLNYRPQYTLDETLNWLVDYYTRPQIIRLASSNFDPIIDGDIPHS